MRPLPSIHLLKSCTRPFSTHPSPQRLNILFFGQDEFSCGVFKHVHAAQDVWTHITIATNPDAKVGRRRDEIRTSPMKLLGRALEVPVCDTPPKGVGMKTWEVPRPFSDAPQRPEHVLVTASFGRILPPKVLDYFAPRRRLNVHPSLLPQYRGPSPIQCAIADGLSETGVSVISVLPYKYGIDSGDVWAAERMPISPGVRYAELRDVLADKGGELLVRTLRGILAGTATAVPQDHEKATRAPLVYRKDAMVQWDTWDAFRVDRVHRAINHQHPILAALPYAHPHSSIQLHDLTVRSPPASLHPKLQGPGDAIYDRPSKALVIRCANDTEISVTRVQQEVKKALGAWDFWNGVRPERLEDGVLKLCSIAPPENE